jgi:lysophospholipid acyltransferase (LPLAT)-like uncharacterized protein
MSLVYRCVRKVGYLLRLRLETHPGLAWRSAMAATAWLMRLHGWTLRYRVNDKAGYFAGRLRAPVIILLWHNRIFSIPACFERYNRKRRSAVVLTSASPEGSLLTLLMAHFGIGAVRGSTSRRASVALREMATRMAEGQDVAITPDGPRGPRYRLQPGALFLAQQTGYPIVLVHVEYSRYRRFKTWDGFALPIPFARVDVIFDEPFSVNSAKTEEEFEIERLQLERRMTQSLRMD